VGVLVTTPGAGLIARASDTYANYPPANAIDGDETTSWYTATGCDNACCAGLSKWLEVQFPAATTARHVLIRGNRDSYATGYDVLSGVIEVYRTDGGVSSTPFVTNRPDGDTLVSVGSAAVRNVARIRMVIHSTETTSDPGIGELRVYGE
jgi:hypothetical protein